MTIGTAIVIVGAMLFVAAMTYLAFVWSFMRKGLQMVERDEEIDKRTLEDFRQGARRSEHRFKL